MFEQFERDFRRLIFKISRLLITRFPFWEAFSTAMIMGEWHGKNRSHGIPDYAVYAHIGICILLGTLMSFDDHKKRQSALFAAVQMSLVTVSSLLIWDGNRMVQLKIFGRNVGIVGAYLLFSSGFADLKASHRRYGQLGNLFIGGSLVAESYILNFWSAEKEKIFDLLPSQLSSAQDGIVLIFSILLCLCAFCFITGQHIKLASKCTVALWVLIVVSDANYKSWAGHLELWAQYRILAADMCLASVFAVNYAMS